MNEMHKGITMSIYSDSRGYRIRMEQTQSDEDHIVMAGKKLRPSCQVRLMAVDRRMYMKRLYHWYDITEDTTGIHR